MSMSTHVTGFRPPDEKWRKMKAVWDASEAAGVEPPKEVLAFFNHVEPDPGGVRVDLGPALKEYRGEAQDGFEIDVTKLPKDVTLIRFYNSY